MHVTGDDVADQGAAATEAVQLVANTFDVVERLRGLTAKPDALNARLTFFDGTADGKLPGALTVLEAYSGMRFTPSASAGENPLAQGRRSPPPLHLPQRSRGAGRPSVPVWATQAPRLCNPDKPVRRTCALS